MSNEREDKQGGFEAYWRDASDGCSDLDPKMQKMLKEWARDAWNHAPRSASAAHWEEEARRYAQNADFWRAKYESALSSSTDRLAASLAVKLATASSLLTECVEGTVEDCADWNRRVREFLQDSPRSATEASKP